MHLSRLLVLWSWRLFLHKLGLVELTASYRAICKVHSLRSLTTIKLLIPLFLPDQHPWTLHWDKLSLYNTERLEIHLPCSWDDCLLYKPHLPNPACSLKEDLEAVKRWNQNFSLSILDGKKLKLLQATTLLFAEMDPHPYFARSLYLRIQLHELVLYWNHVYLYLLHL